MRKKIKRRGRFYVYVVRCNNDSLYTGYTNNLKKRIVLHNNGKGAKYTRDRRPVKLAWFKEYRNFRNAFLEEKRIKKLTRPQKEQLINGQKMMESKCRRMSIKVRKINQQDKEAFVELSLALTKFNKRQHGKHYSNFQEFLKVRKRRAEEACNKINQSPNRLFLMAFQNNKPVGYVRAFIYGPKLRQGCLDEFFLRKEARGQGIGKKLLEAATQWMRKRRIIRMIVSVYLWNTPASAFYEQEGFLNYAVSYEKVISSSETK
ncbi:GNAT family N-acetyltransferase [Candidatus Omnitrophota bacterium]